jgi:ribonucleoside-diphosphate reductase alpha chain
MAKAWNNEDVQAHPPRRDEASVKLAQERGACPDAADMGRDGSLLLQDGDRADRVDLDHLRRHLALHRADPGQHLYAQDAVGLASSVKNPYLERCWQKGKDSRPMSGTRSSNTAARSSTSTS